MDKEIIKENIKKICSEVTPFDKKSFEDRTKPSKLFFTNKTLVRIEDLSLRAFYEVLNELMSDDFIKRNFTGKYVEKKLEELIVKIMNRKEDIRFDELDDELDRFRESIKKDISERTFIYPIVNLKITKPIVMGNVTFISFSEEHKSIKEHCFKILETSKSPKEVVESMKKQDEDTFKFLNQFVCAKVNIRGEASKCIESGYEIVERSLDVLRLYVPLNVYSGKGFVGVFGDLTATKALVLYFDDRNFSWHHEIKGFLLPFEIKNEYIKLMEDNGLSRINHMLTRSRNNFENSLITAMHWFGKAIKNVEDKDRFLCFFIALETLLVKDKNEPVVNCLRERIAFLLEKKKERRIQLSKIIRDLYDLRSRIVHSGLMEVPPRDMRQLHLITQQVVLTLVNGKMFSGRDDFFACVEELK